MGVFDKFKDLMGFEEYEEEEVEEVVFYCPGYLTHKAEKDYVQPEVTRELVAFAHCFVFKFINYAF